MSKTKVKINYSAVGDLLKSAEMASAIRPYAEAIANSAPHCEVDETVLQTRVRIGVVQHMTHIDMKDHTLLKAVHFQ